MTLPNGSIQTPPDLPGKWSVWSKAADAPGAYFLVPLDDQARACGIQYAVVKAIQKRGKAHPELMLMRTVKATS